MARVRWKIGRLFRIPLETGVNAFALSLNDPEFAFFQYFSAASKPEDVLAAPLLWRLWVQRSAIRTGRWQPVADLAKLPTHLSNAVPRFKKDVISGDYAIYLNGKERPATRNECIDLEAAAVWGPEHVESRLRDFIAGVPNKWAQSLEP